MKKYTMVIALHECVLTWYIKYYTDNLLAALVDIQTTLNKKFNRPKSEAQSIIGFKEIMMKPRKRPRELHQGLKCKIYEPKMNLTDGQHYEWFMVLLLLHMRVALSQQKIGTQVEALEIVMSLHKTPIQDATLGVQ